MGRGIEDLRQPLCGAHVHRAVLLPFRPLVPAGTSALGWLGQERTGVLHLAVGRGAVVAVDSGGRQQVRPLRSLVPPEAVQPFGVGLAPDTAVLRPPLCEVVVGHVGLLCRFGNRRMFLTTFVVIALAGGSFSFRQRS